MFKTISYGITGNYLKHWDSSSMLREVFQNFKDFGDYELYEADYGSGITGISISNDFKPENMDFLFIGESSKGDDDIGGHGEGLKMAGLIAAREGLSFNIVYRYEKMSAIIDNDGLFKFQLWDSSNSNDSKFTISLTVKTEIWKEFKSREISEDDIIHSSIYGDIVNKNPGDIYVGGLYVCNLKKFKRSYNFKPNYIKLDRDRSTPSNFDIEYYASKISSGFEDDFSFEDLDKRDYTYVERIPEEMIKEVEVDVSDPESIKIKDPDGNTITNTNVKNYIFRSSYVSEKIKKAKMMIAEKLGLVEMLESFLEKHALTTSAKMEMEIIIQKAKGENE